MRQRISAILLGGLVDVFYIVDAVVRVFDTAAISHPSGHSFEMPVPLFDTRQNALLSLRLFVLVSTSILK